MDWQVLSVVLVLALVMERLLEAIGEPICRLIGKWQTVDPDVKRLAYIVIGSGLGYLTGLNMLPIFALAPIAGHILTAVAVGAGSQVIHLIINDLGKKENIIIPPA